jgi:hypothetical protein
MWLRVRQTLQFGSKIDRRGNDFSPVAVSMIPTFDGDKIPPELEKQESPYLELYKPRALGLKSLLDRVSQWHLQLSSGAASTDQANDHDREQDPKSNHRV